MTVPRTKRFNHPLKLTPVLCLLGSIALLSLLLGGCAGPGEEQIPLLPRQSHFDTYLPYPEKFPAFAEDTLAPRDGLLQIVPILLQIDSVGNAAGVEPVRSDDSLIVGSYRDYLTAIQFAPGLADSNRMAMTLPVILETIDTGRTPELRFPVQRNRGIPDAELYWLALEMNEIDLADIAAFPSYFYRDTEDSDTMPVTSPGYDLMLLRVVLGREGRPTQIDTLMSTVQGLAMTMRSAALWAEYEPYVVRGAAVPGTLYVSVAFLPEVEYPTRPLPMRESSPPDSLAWLHDFRLRLLVDTIGPAREPLPRRPLDGQIVSAAVKQFPGNNYVVTVDIDTAGYFGVAEVHPDDRRGREGGEFRRALRRLLAQLEFHPAYDFEGRPLPFTGRLLIRRHPPDTVVQVGGPANWTDEHISDTVLIDFDWHVRSLFGRD
ncbi:hypothetical protein GF377_06965 [candidate division GN15 bacterium]|nr:hypothetical protein [candidate division GN15 bacterium]